MKEVFAWYRRPLTREVGRVGLQSPSFHRPRGAAAGGFPGAVPALAAVAVGESSPSACWDRAVSLGGLPRWSARCFLSRMGESLRGRAEWSTGRARVVSRSIGRPSARDGADLGGSRSSSCLRPEFGRQLAPQPRLPGRAVGQCCRRGARAASQGLPQAAPPPSGPRRGAPLVSPSGTDERGAKGGARRGGGARHTNTAKAASAAHGRHSAMQSGQLKLPARPPPAAHPQRSKSVSNVDLGRHCCSRARCCCRRGLGARASVCLATEGRRPNAHLSYTERFWGSLRQAYACVATLNASSPFDTGLLSG
mmetsp:Transcript_12242/g.29064  ORF Transcript_12242/g.29064 Transcript_12242/m.29064 type:complete len:308 (-) Transcript_12242:305-1228(-)